MDQSPGTIKGVLRRRFLGDPFGRDKMFLKSFTTIITGSLLLALTACQNGTNFGLSSVNQGYQQRVSETIVKVDVLWVVDS